jgi:hypothetical protein
MASTKIRNKPRTLSLPEPCVAADDPDEEPYFWSADGDRSELRQTAAAQAGLLHGADVGQRRGERVSGRC